MNSREKQRRALHANRSVIARIHQLPLYMKVINVILAIVLALGVGSNWAYAAELIPEPMNTTETMTMAYDENPVVYAPEAAGASTYEWQVYLPDRDIYAPIGGESKSSLTLSSSLLDNESVLNEKREGTVRCVVSDSEGNELNTKSYVVTLGEASSVNQSLASSALQSAKVEAETVSSNDASTDAQEELNAEENKTFTVKIRFYASIVSEETYLGYELKSDFEVTAEKGFDWLVRVNSDLGKVASLSVPATFKDKIVASKTSAIGFDDAIYIQGFKELAAMEETTCTIDAIYDVNAFKYTVHAFYQDLDNPGSYTEKIVVREASLNMPVPTTPTQYYGSVDDETFFKDGGTNGEMGKGWKIVEFHGDTVRNVDQDKEQPGVSVIMYLDHEYSVLDFNLLGNLESKGEDPGTNGPIAVYMRNGEDFNSIQAWKQNNYLPTPTPVKSAYVFDHWYYIDGMTQRSMPTDTWEGQKAPGVQRTYYAYWNLESKITEAKVTIAYWGQTVDSPYNNPKYEYLIERYDTVPANKIGDTYSLPATEGARDPMQDRRYPQVRVSGQEIQCTSTIEYVDGTKDIYSSNGYKYNVLYEYSGYQTAVVKADGSTTIKVWLKRAQRYIRFSYTPVGSYTTVTEDLVANWDADIKDQYLAICQKAKGTDWSTWTSQKTGQPTSVLLNMPKYLRNDSVTDGRADTWSESTRTPNNRFAGYYIHKVDATSTEHPTGQNMFNAQPTGRYLDYWETKAYVEVTFQITADDDYVAILGFQTPSPGGGHAVRNGVTWSSGNCACFYYFRNEKSLYLRNIHGVTDCPTTGQYANMPYHQDQCVSVGQHYNTNSKQTSTDDPVRYEKLAGDLAFPGTERSEFVVNQWATGTGASGITAGTLLKEFTPIVPNTVDQHFVFDGWFSDPNYDEAARVDFSTWKMPNHEQDLFAHWVAPKCKLEFMVNDPSTGDPEKVVGGVQQCTYDEYPKEEGVSIPKIDAPQGHKFIAWYYYQNEADAKAKTNKVWFNPETMTMPFVEWGEASDTNNVDNAANDVMVLHQLWADDNDVDYTFKFVLGPDDTGYEIASPKQGHSKVGGTDPSFTLEDDYSNVSFYEGYYGVVKLINGEDKTKSIHLTYDYEENVAIFHFEYDPNKAFYYRIEYWAVTPNMESVEMIEADPVGGGDTPEEQRKSAEGWSKTQNYEYSYTLRAEVDRYHDKGLTLASAEWTTITLRSDIEQDPDEKEDYAHPSQNIIQIFYKPLDKVTFTYKAVTYDNMTDQNPLTNNGGKIVAPTGGTETIDPYFDTARSTSRSHPGFKFAGWYETEEQEDGSKILGDPVPGEWVITSGTDSTLTVDKGDFFIYMQDAEYWAVFVYEDDSDKLPTITYDTRIIDGNGQLLNTDGHDANVTLKCGNDGTPGVTVSEKLTTALTTPKAVTVANELTYYPYKNWLDEDDQVITGAAKQPFYAKALFFNDGADGYYYYETTHYTCVFDERQASQVTLTYKVAEDQTEMGNVRLGYTGSSTAKTISETAYPKLGNPAAGATSTNPKVYSAIASVTESRYEFDSWSWVDSEGNSHTSSEPTLPEYKEGGLYVATTFIAHFKLGKVKITTTAGAHGDIKETKLTQKEVDAGTKYAYDTDGTLYFYAPDDQEMDDPIEELTQTPDPYLGYENATPPWKDNTTGTPQELTFQPIMSDMTFICSFIDKTGVTLTYKVQTGSNTGYIIESGDVRELQYHTQNITNPATCDAPATVTAYPRTADGYEFKYWTIDEEDTDDPESQYTDPKAPVTRDTEDGHSAYKSHTYYAHFGTYATTVTIDVYYSYAEKNEIKNGETYGKITLDNIQTGTPYTYGASVGTGPGETDQGWLTIGGTTGIAQNKHDAGENTWNFASWQMETDPTSHTTKGLPGSGTTECKIMGETHFVAMFQETGEASYTINYYFQTVASAKTGSDFDAIVPETVNPESTGKWTNWKSYPDADHNDGVAGRFYPSVTGKAQGGTSVTIVYADPIGFNYGGINSDPDAVSGTTWILSGDETHNNVLNVFYMRETKYPFVIDTYVETIKSARDNRNPGDPHPVGTDGREYEFNYTLSIFGWDPGEEGTKYGTLQGIYGSEITIPLHVFEYEGTESWEVKYDHAPLKPGEIDKFSYVIGSYGWGDPEYFVKIADTSSLKHERQKADSPNAGVLNLACNINPYYSFKIEVYRELPDGTYPAAAEATITNTNCGANHYDDMTRVSSEELVALNEDGRTLKDEYQVSTWDDVCPVLTPSTTDTFKTWLSGYNYASCAPNNGKIIVSDWNNDPTLKLYYKRSNSISYQVNLFQETVGSAQARFGTLQPPTVFTPSGTYTPNPPDARLGETLNLNFLKTYYDEQGFRVYEGGSTYTSKFTIDIVADATKNVANIYYIRQDNVSFQVQYFQQGLDGSYPTLPTDTKSYSGIFELEVYTDAKTGDHSTQPQGFSPYEDFRVRADYHGFTFDPTSSDPKPTAKIGYGTVIKLYYSRNENTEWNIQFYTQGIIEATGQPDPDWTHAALKETVRPAPTGKTGSTVSFADYVNGNTALDIPAAKDRYDGFNSLDHVGVWNGTRETTVTNYELTIDSQGRSEARIYIKRNTKYEYQIWDYVQTVDASGQPEDNYVLLQSTHESYHGVYGATVQLIHKNIQGYTPKTGGYWPDTGVIKIGDKYTYEGQTDNKTIGRLFYNAVLVNYTVELQRETLDSAKERRLHSREKANALYDSVWSRTRQAYTSQKIFIEPVKDELFALAEALGCEFYKTEPSLVNASSSVSVNADGTTKITVYVLRSINRTITANFYRESLAHAHDKSVTQVYDPALNELNVTIENLITGEDLVYATTDGFYNRYDGFYIYESNPADHLVISNDPSVSQSCDIGYWREITDDWNYYVGYRVETKDSAQRRIVDPTLAPEFEVFKDDAYPEQWNEITPGIYGDVIDKDAKKANEDRTPGEALARDLGMGYTFYDCNPTSITVSENLPVASRYIEYRYLRNPNVLYHVQVYQQDFDGTAPVENSYHKYGNEINLYGVYETTVTDQTPDIQRIIGDFEEDMKGYDYHHCLPAEGITIDETGPTLNLFFNNDPNNRVVIYHYGENATSAQNRADTWTWDIDHWVIPADEPEPVIDIALTGATEIMQGTEANPIWTGTTIQLGDHVISTAKGTDYYGYDGEHAIHEGTYTVKGDDDSTQIDYKRMVWTVTPEPQPIDPDDSRTYPLWAPNPIAVAHGNGTSIDPAEELYIIAIPVDDVYPTEDVTVPVNYREKVYRVTYLSNDTALGTVDPETEDCMILTGNMVGSNANAVGGAKFENWTNEAGEIVSTDINYVPERYPVPDPELLTANAEASSNGEVFAEATFTANFSAVTVEEVSSQTGDASGGLIALASICAIVAAYVLIRRRNAYKVIGTHVK